MGGVLFLNAGLSFLFWHGSLLLFNRMATAATTTGAEKEGRNNNNNNKKWKPQTHTKVVIVQRGERKRSWSVERSKTDVAAEQLSPAAAQPTTTTMTTTRTSQLSAQPHPPLPPLLAYADVDRYFYEFGCCLLLLSVCFIPLFRLSLTHKLVSSYTYKYRRGKWVDGLLPPSPLDNATEWATLRGGSQPTVKQQQQRKSERRYAQYVLSLQSVQRDRQPLLPTRQDQPTPDTVPPTATDNRQKRVVYNLSIFQKHTYVCIVAVVLCADCCTVCSWTTPPSLPHSPLGNFILLS